MKKPDPKDRMEFVVQEDGTSKETHGIGFQFIDGEYVERWTINVSRTNSREEVARNLRWLAEAVEKGKANSSP